MKNIQIVVSLLTFTLFFNRCVTAQDEALPTKTNASSFSDYTQSFISIDTSKIALINAQVIDGTGDSPKANQTILIENGIITKVSPSDQIQAPTSFYNIDLTGKTVIPGLVGTHNHMRMHMGALLATSPRLYLAAGVTTIQTCGTGNTLEEIAIAKSINKGEQPGPQIVNSGPYFTGPEGRSNFIRCTDTNEKEIRDTIRSLANHGVKWLKAYENVRPQDLKIIVDEAHKNNLKVTGHLCATTYAEAAAIGIDAVEHGLIASFDHQTGKKPGFCSRNRDFILNLDIESPEVKQVQQMMIDNGVVLSSTLSCFEVLPNTAEADPRDLEVMSARHLNAYYSRQERKKNQGKNWWFKDAWYTKEIEYDYQYFKMGGFVVSGF